MSMATPGGGNPQPDSCPQCGAVALTEVGMTVVPGDSALHWMYQCAKCDHRFLWPPPPG